MSLPLNGYSFNKRFVDSRRSIFTAQECKDGHPSVNRQGVDVLFPMGASDEIDYYIDTLAVGCFLHMFCEIVACIVHDMGRSIWDRKEPIQLVPG